MDIEEIEVEIMPDGTLQLKVKGVKGSACLEITHDLEMALGGKVISREMTAEAFNTALSSEVTGAEKVPVRTLTRNRRKKGTSS